MATHKTRLELEMKGPDGLTLADRLRKLWQERGGGTYEDFARRCGAPENTAKGWLNGKSLPGGAHLRGISLGYQVTTDFILFGVTGERATGATVQDHATAAAPESIPPAVREDYGWLVQQMGLDYGGHRSLEQAREGALRLVTAMLAEARRLRGERKRSPQPLLEDLRNYRGERGLTRYLFWSLLAAEQVVRLQRPPTAKGAPNTKRKPRTGRK
jgi:transcriptional regulator with XRE-family HTH domain